MSSFGADSAVLLHLVAAIDPATPVVFVDTGMLFSETLAYRDRLVADLGLTHVTRYAPSEDDLAEQDPESFLWAREPDQCCHIRKVLPLARALDGYDAWISGRKRFQAETREALPIVEAEGVRTKINPLADWSAKDNPRLHGRQRPAATRTDRQELFVDRLHALHQPGPTRRGCARRTMARQGQAGMRHSHRLPGSGCRHLMAYFTNDAFAEDSWAGRTVPSIVELREMPAPLPSPLGVALDPGFAIESLADLLPSLSLIVIAFPKFTDGRGYSMGWLLRDRLGYKGEMRASGDVLFDEMRFMLRCGFDAFEIVDPSTLTLLRDGRRPLFDRFYQPGLDPEVPVGTRPWARRLA